MSLPRWRGIKGEELLHNDLNVQECDATTVSFLFFGRVQKEFTPSLSFFLAPVNSKHLHQSL